MILYGPAWVAWNFVADFGDLAAVGPACCAGCAALWWRGRRVAALTWAGAFWTVVAVTFVAKAAAGDPGYAFLAPLYSGPAPSGHTAISLAFYAALAAALSISFRGWGGWLSAATSGAAALLVVAAITILGWHPWPDIVQGAVLGTVAGAVAWRALRRRMGQTDARLAATAALLVLLALHGARLYADKEGVSIRYEAWPSAPAEAKPWAERLRTGGASTRGAAPSRPSGDKSLTNGISAGHAAAPALSAFGAGS